MSNANKIQEFMTRFFTSVDFLIKLVEQGEPTAAEKIAIDVKKSMVEAQEALSFFVTENSLEIERLKETVKGLLEERADDDLAEDEAIQGTEAEDEN